MIHGSLDTAHDAWPLGHSRAWPCKHQLPWDVHARSCHAESEGPSLFHEACTSNGPCHPLCRKACLSNGPCHIPQDTTKEQAGTGRWPGFGWVASCSHSGLLAHRVTIGADTDVPGLRCAGCQKTLVTTRCSFNNVRRERL